MSEDGDADADDGDRQREQLQFVGYGIVLSGVLTLAVATISTRPHGILVWGLGGLAVAALILEQTQGGAGGFSLGLLTGSFGVWAWGHLDGGGHLLLGAILVAAGGFNALLTPQFRRLGERLAER